MLTDGKTSTYQIYESRQNIGKNVEINHNGSYSLKGKALFAIYTVDGPAPNILIIPNL